MRWPFPNEKPPAVSRRGLLFKRTSPRIRRSGIEVAVDAEFRRPSALVGERAKRNRLRARTEGSRGGTRRRLQLGVNHVETDIGLRVDVELGTGTEVPVRPVVVT